jgi:predicted nucleic acid-binding protein
VTALPVIMLVDTCVWFLALRRSAGNLNVQEAHAVESLKHAILDGNARMAGVVRQELLSGVREKSQFESLRTATRAFEDVALTITDYEDAAACDNLCRLAGISGGTTDFLLCAIAIRRQWAILTVDKDFSNYAKKLPLRLVPQ